jgi:hypothetical protein
MALGKDNRNNGIGVSFKVTYDIFNYLFFLVVLEFELRALDLLAGILPLQPYPHSPCFFNYSKVKSKEKKQN